MYSWRKADYGAKNSIISYKFIQKNWSNNLKLKKINFLTSTTPTTETQMKWKRKSNN